MQLHQCLALPISALTASPDDAIEAREPCLLKVSPPSPFCPAHEDEYRALLLRKAAATREAERFRVLVDDMLANDAAAASAAAPDARGRARDKAIARMYADALGEVVDAMRELKVRFYVDGESRALCMLENAD